MSKLDKFVQETGDEASDLIKEEIKGLIEDVRSDSEKFLQETGYLVEAWLIKKAKGEFSSKELERLIKARKLEAKQYLNTKDIKARAKVERLTNRIIELTINGAIDVIL